MFRQVRRMRLLSSLAKGCPHARLRVSVGRARAGPGFEIGLSNRFTSSDHLGS